MKRSDFEIMAPVGSRESLAAAIKAGANSIYFGIGKLNMRSHSANAFTIDDLKEIAAISGGLSTTQSIFVTPGTLQSPSTTE